jgi:hypothetical protein
LISQQFFVERQRLFSELDGLLNKLSRLTLKMKPYNELKHALGLSSRSIVHEWSTAGVASIRGYSTYIDNASKAARFLKAGGWLAIGFAGANTTNEVYNACTVGREQSCSKVAVKKYSSFGASLAGVFTVVNTEQWQVLVYALRLVLRRGRRTARLLHCWGCCRWIRWWRDSGRSD